MSDKIIAFILDRLDEPSTWQAIGFVLVLLGCKFAAQANWGDGAALGATVSAAIKLFTPDEYKSVWSDFRAWIRSKLLRS